ncbi:MAG: GspE/PulE family protein [Patescibacteria group bacterium]|nr:GspE/PulE family protein [Patescibacteria group bacterium]MDD4304212.1 GspE/PulE family protein [Patescibacteria group bacterium]MDD4695245.1 GspE/PulE family protein [Patescibacteria group bacterium]
MQVDYNDKIFNKIQELSSITKDKLEFLKKKLVEENQNIDSIIKKYYLIDLENYAQIKATVIGMPYKNLLDEKVNAEALKLLPINLSANYKMVIFNKRDKVLDVGLVDPEDFSAIEAVEFLAHKNNYKLKYYLISEESFNSVFKKTENIKQQVNEALDYAKEEFEEIVDESQFDEENLGDIIKTAPVTKIISVLLKHAVEGRASDIHIEPVSEKSIIRFRIDGKLHNSIVLPIYIHNALIARVKVMANMKIDETRIPQDGRIRVAMKRGKDVKKIDFRVSTLPLIDYEKVVMRILSTPEKVPEFEELGFFGNSKRMIEEAISKPNGMILVTGPTGSGKSFTLFTALNKINSELINICTLEDPVEYNIKGINQSQVRPEVNYTFASGLRSLLRQDPDVIMVGEIRDSETAKLAVHAALTGHLVFSTLHTNDAIGAIPRLIDMKIEPFLLSSTLNLVFAQRLVRRICDNCKEEMILSDILKEQISSSINDLPESAFYGNVKKGDVIKFYHGKGCNRCGGTGYKGRIAINEVFVPNRALKDVINDGNDMGKFQDELKKQGYINMMQDGLIKVLSGMTTLEEVLRATKEF